MKVAILGTAHAHVSVYCDSWSDRDDIDIVSAWDHDANRLESFSSRLSIDAVHDLDRVLCLRQYRHAVRHRLIELPAGLKDAEGEEIQDAGALPDPLPALLHTRGA